ncbi:protein kinase [Corallococcus sp. bb12-1]|uniref:serine/threonine protein kinase n=1 Tax=Corallococcus sp. bb12-1 TaxID=2996784 RepID=UPI00226D50A0|nr:serine/threonine protein kinase [Corallococcus sp. bb12-1]MCY1046745.1 protein kinase [Corallococcus sp. bb12-1]
MAPERSQVFPAALQPGTEVGRWRVLGTLGVGGYGAVYRVEPLEGAGRSFALKLSLHPDPARALREMSLLLDRAWHPQVVRVHATGRWPDPIDGLPYFVMDCVEGVALHTWAEVSNPTFRQLAMVGGSVAMTLDVLHARGVLHRDLKPEHILVREPGHVPVLIDFGAGDQAGATTLTTTTLPPGTLHLRSPEAIRFQQLHWRQPEVRYPYTEADDLYALGVCLYRAATGHYPFSPELTPDLLTVAITQRLPPSPRAINPQVPAPFATAILRLLEKEPERRPRTGVQAHAELVEGLLSDGAAFEARLFDEVPGEVPGRIRRPEWPSQPYRTAETEPVALLPLMRPASWLQSQGGAGLINLMVCLMLLVTGSGTWEVLSRAWTRNTTPGVLTNASASSGHKLASPPERSHSVPVAAPLTTGPPLATVAPVATPLEERSPVTSKHVVSSPVAPPLKPSRPLKAVMASVCMGMACASNPPLMSRPTPPSEDCPAESVESMKRLGVAGALLDGLFDRKVMRGNVTVREGRGSLWVYGLKGVRDGDTLTGEFYVGSERVYGRFTQLRQKKTGETHPVCFEFWTVNDRQTGLPRLSGGNEDTAVLFNKIQIRSVIRYDEN